MLFPRTLSTSPELAALVSPIPVLPAPAQACAPSVTITYVSSSSTVEMTAARPGVWFASAVSSLQATAVSQPQ